LDTLKKLLEKQNFKDESFVNYYEKRVFNT
jgi:hypothetical protein